MVQLLLFLAAFSLLGFASGRDDRFNVLFLASDDLRPNLGAYQDVNSPIYSSPLMYTPNLDALASKSMLFERAFVQQALCSPSRTSLLTSRRPDTTRITRIGTYWRDLGGNFTTLPQYFKENGYMTVGGGKIFHGGPSSPNHDPPSWSKRFNSQPEDPDDKQHSWKAFTAEELAEAPLRDTRQTDHMINMLRLFGKNATLGIQPLFLALGLHKPHLPNFFPEEFLQYYPEEDIDLPFNMNCPQGMPDSAWHAPEVTQYADCLPEAVGVPEFGNINVTLPIQKIKELRRAYYATISYVDHEIGKIIDKLIEMDLFDSTIIVFWGDHGWQLGEHAGWSKLVNFEIGTRVPFMIRVPGVTDAGMRTSKKVEMVDLFPTLVELAGLDPIPTCPKYSNDLELCTEGASMASLFTNPESEFKDAVFWQHPRGMVVDNIPENMGYSIYTDQYHYIEWVQLRRLGGHAYEPDWDTQIDHPELYLVDTDIQENLNVYDQPQYAEVIKELSERLHAGWTAELPSFK